ncbi:hypothetical protein Y032_0027g1561 [Ancylostoma ceylanicum]|nr:hypothetical protein Y032_0027g1561 [Ancylostoma ceylanicum]
MNYTNISRNRRNYEGTGFDSSYGTLRAKQSWYNTSFTIYDYHYDYHISAFLGSSCDPLPDTRTARLMYYQGSSIIVGPRSPLNDGTVARLKCNFDTMARGMSRLPKD